MSFISLDRTVRKFDRSANPELNRRSFLPSCLPSCTYIDLHNIDRNGQLHTFHRHPAMTVWPAPIGEIWRTLLIYVRSPLSISPLKNNAAIASSNSRSPSPSLTDIFTMRSSAINDSHLIEIKLTRQIHLIDDHDQLTVLQLLEQV